MRKAGILFALIATVALLLVAVPQSVSQAGYEPTPTAGIEAAGGKPPIEVKVAKRPPAAKDKPDHVPGELIVKLKPGADDAALPELGSKHGVKLAKKLLLPDYSLLSVPLDKDLAVVADELRQDPRVDAVELNGYYHLLDFTPNDLYYGYQWNLPKVQMPKAWDLTNGDGVIVAVVDTGVAYETYGPYVQASDLANTTFLPGWDFVNDDAHPNDDYGHGTHVAGTIAQSTNNGIGVAGIAFGAEIMPVKVLDDAGKGTWVNIADGIVWAADHGAKVINLSLGGTDTTSAVESAVNYAFAKGVVVVAAAGNDSTHIVSYPAAYQNVIAVGATSYDDSMAPYSNYGSALDLMAPGGNTDIDQSGDGWPDGILQQTFCNPKYDPYNAIYNPQGCSQTDPTRFKYYFFEGTSMAAPHVSAVAALLIANGTATTPDQVQQALQSTARDLGDPGWDLHYGYGLVQAYDALCYEGGCPSLQLSSNTAVFLMDPGASNVASRTIMIANAGRPALNWTATKSSENWFSLSSMSGTAPSSLTITVDRTGLAGGTYWGTVTITGAPGTRNSPQQIQVRLYVGPVFRADLAGVRKNVN